MPILVIAEYICGYYYYYYYPEVYYHQASTASKLSSNYPTYLEYSTQ